MDELKDVSVFESILVDIRNIIQESDEFKNIEVYFDDVEMNSNISLPAISFRVGQKEVIDSSATCTTYSRRLEIRLHTKTPDKRMLQRELYLYEEHLTHLINQAKLNNRIPSYYDIIETGSSSIMALMFNAKKEANQFNMTFFSNLLKVRFVIRYEI